jgi:hypothetical protein
LNSGVHLLDVGLFAVIHSLPYTRWLFRFVVHCIVILQEPATAVAIPLRVRATVLPMPRVRLRQI